MRAGRGDAAGEARYLARVPTVPTVATVPPVEDPYRLLARLLREHPGELVSRWGDAFERSPLRLPRPVARAELVPLVQSMIESLALALPGAGQAAPLVPGAPAARELEKAVAFAGASLAAAGLSGFDVAALILALRDVVVPHVAPANDLGRLFEWLSIVALDAFATTTDLAARERVREQIGRGTPVVLVAARVPAALLVADPDSRALDSVFGRLVLLVVRTGAPCVIIDAAGLDDPGAPQVLEALGHFAGHDKIAGVADIVAVGLADQHARAWQRVARDAGATLSLSPRFRDAVATALARLDLAVLPARAPAETGPGRGQTGPHP